MNPAHSLCLLEPRAPGLERNRVNQGALAESLERCDCPTQGEQVRCPRRPARTERGRGAGHSVCGTDPDGSASAPGEKCSPRYSPRHRGGCCPSRCDRHGAGSATSPSAGGGAGGAPGSRGPDPARPPRRPAARGPVNTGDQGFRLGELCLDRPWRCGHHFHFPANSAVCPEKDGGEASTWRPRSCSLVPPQCDQRTRNQGASNPELGLVEKHWALQVLEWGRVGRGKGGSREG